VIANQTFVLRRGRGKCKLYRRGGKNYIPPLGEKTNQVSFCEIVKCRVVFSSMGSWLAFYSV
jgi:hypothetical protein